MANKRTATAPQQMSTYPDYIDSFMGYTSSSPDRTNATQQAAPGTSAAPTGSANIGTLNYGSTQGGYNASSLPSVSDPDKTMADVSRRQHESYITNFRDFENALIAARDDTSLIDAVPEDVETQARVAKGIQERNKKRYGYTSTAAEEAEAERDIQRGTALDLAGGLTNARLAQREQNMQLLGDLINIGQGVNRSSLSQLGTAGENAVMRKNAFQQAQAQSKAQRNSMIGSMGTALAAFLI
jgi:hypothetical protein